MTLKVKKPICGNGEEKEEYRVDASNYKKYADTRTHIYEIPDSYVGSWKRLEREERVFDFGNKLFKDIMTEIPQAVERVFVEISSNAGDNAARSIRHDVDPGEIKITMNKHTIVVKNGGLSIPIEIHETEKVYAPQVIFGMLHSSSNYKDDEDRTECGRNGYGAKLTNIFSKRFQVICCDPYNEKLYTQIWEKNMTICHPPTIVPCKKTDKAFVEISYTLDFARFGYTEYPEDAFELFSRHAADMAFALKVPVSFNKEKFHIKDAREYAKLYLGAEAVKNSILYISWPAGTETVMKKGTEYSVKEGVLPIAEICAVDTPDNAVNVAFANGMWTRNKGVHYEAAFKAVASGVLETVNNNMRGTKKEKKGKGKKTTKTGTKKTEKKEKEVKIPKLNIGDVKKHVSLFCSIWVAGPTFDSQSKNMLMSPTPKIVVDEAVLKSITNWDLVSRLFAELEAKMFRTASKTDGKKKKILTGMDALEDANKAGTNESMNCILYLTEGNSAQTFASKLISHVPGGRGRNYMGTFPLRGKPLNVMNAPPLQVIANREVNNLKEILGLKEGVNYLVQENYEALRYGHVVIIADSDEDAKHIIGLVLNIFHVKFPTLLARGYIKYLRTMILQVINGNVSHKFYTQHDYEVWKESQPDSAKWRHKYYKGLASNDDASILYESQDPKIVMTEYDELAPSTFQLCFHGKMADERKKWIADWEPDYSVEKLVQQPISSFLNQEFIQFSIADIKRSIPRFTDGLKVSQRKIIWAALKKWKGKKDNSKEAGEMKVAQFAAYVADKLVYAHGEMSLCGAIVGMAQDFPGANNLPDFTTDGQFGSRTGKLSGVGARIVGTDAGSSRYIHTKPFVTLKWIYRKEDNPLLDIIVEEGVKVEPVTLLPILPMHLINGQIGVATGYSTMITSHNPLDVVYWYEARLKNLPRKILVPWYRGFEGQVKLRERLSKDEKLRRAEEKAEEKAEAEDREEQAEKSAMEEGREEYEPEVDEGEVEFEEPKEERSKTKKGEDDEDEDEVEEEENTIKSMDPNATYSVITKGTFEILDKKKNLVRVTEIPIGVAISKYKHFLEGLRDEKKIKNLELFSEPNKPCFEFIMERPTMNKLKLSRARGLSNMVLLDDRDKPHKYNNTEVLMEAFYHVRLGYYHKRKAYMIAQIDKDIIVLNMKIRFIQAVIKGIDMLKENSKVTTEEANNNGGILLIGGNKKTNFLQMEKMGLDTELIKNITIHHCTEEELERFKNEILKLEEDKKNKESTDPEQLWLNDLEDFVKVYCKHYKCTYTPPKKLTLNVKR